jgi:hypothetical protein
MSRPENSIDSSVIAAKSDHITVDHAVQHRYQAELPADDLSIVGDNDKAAEEPVEIDTSGDYAAAGAETGACFGWLLGVFIGVGFLILPGLGLILVKGSVSAAQQAGIEGAVAGALVGSLVGMFTGWFLRKHRSSSAGRT